MRRIDAVCSYSFILLIKVIDVAIEDLNKELDGNSGVHASICNTKSALKTFQDSLAITI